jgi:hypothetical protein
VQSKNLKLVQKLSLPIILLLGYFFALQSLTQLKSIHMGALVINLMPIAVILICEYFLKIQNKSLLVLTYILVLTSHFILESELWGDSVYYYQVVSDSFYRDSVGFEPSLVLSAPVSSLVFAMFMQYIPKFVIYIAPMTFTIISIVMLRLIQSQVRQKWYSIVCTILFMESSLILIFSYSKYIEFYVFSNLFSWIILFFYMRVKRFNLLKTFLLGLICLTHLLFLPLWLLNFVDYRELTLRYKVFVSFLGLFLSASVVYLVSLLLDLTIVRGNLPLRDSISLGFYTSGLKLGVLVTFVFIVISYFQYGKILNHRMFLLFVSIYFLFASLWNFKLGLPRDLDLLLVPSFILGIAGFILIANNVHYPFQKFIPMLAGISVANSIIASGFVK